MKMELEIKHTNVFERNLKAFDDGFRFIVNQGGRGSSKTFSLIQLLIFKCLTTPKLKVSMVRKSFPSLRRSVMKDFIELMDIFKIYDVRQHNKTENIYRFSNGASIEFFSIDDSKKLRGSKRDICYCNEANELTREEFMQLTMRTSLAIFIDFNPSDDEHWIYELDTDKRATLIKSTYKDNIFLHKNMVEEIENLINVDENYYKIYALGEKPTSSAKIYSHFKQYTDEPDEGDICYGLDIGFAHKSALVETKRIDDKIYVKELLYASSLTTDELCRKVKELTDRRYNVYVDSARPDIIEQLKRNGVTAKLADKKVKEGIDYVRSKEIYIHYESMNLWKEYRSYMYKSDMERNKITEDPVKINDDLMDAMRYSIYSHRKGTPNLNRVRFY